MLSELVLVIPSVLAILGDNPMQSELSSHIGLLGKFFCRSCFVKGQERSNESNEDGQGSATTRSNSVNQESDAESNASSDDSVEKQSAGKGKKKPESLADLVARTREFLSVNETHKT